MNYPDTVNWMFHQLPMYQNQGQSAYKKDLSNSLFLSEYLKFPERKFKSIHVAGTNGKGSTSHMMASILQEAGYKVGLYTSPHLKDFRERISINGKLVGKQFVRGFIQKHKSYFEAHNLSFFEMTVGMAFDYFSKQNVDIAIIEVGLGGRLDSTNIIVPEVSVITNIGLDHTQFLGTTLAEIATEKAGIIKPSIPIVIGETQNATKAIFKRIAKQNNATIYFADQEIDSNYESDLTGSYQRHNIKTAIQAIQLLNPKKFKISKQHIKLGLLNVVKNTSLFGRWQIIQNYPQIICDTAHNREGLEYVMAQLKNEHFKKLHIVFGSVNDKDLDTIIPLMPKEAIYYFAKPNIERGLKAKLLMEKFAKYDLIGTTYKSTIDAVNMAKEKANEDDLIFIGGSTFIVAEII